MFTHRLMFKSPPNVTEKNTRFGMVYTMHLGDVVIETPTKPDVVQKAPIKTVLLDPISGSLDIQIESVIDKIVRQEDAPRDIVNVSLWRAPDDKTFMEKVDIGLMWYEVELETEVNCEH